MLTGSVDDSFSIIDVSYSNSNININFRLYICSDCVALKMSNASDMATQHQSQHRGQALITLSHNRQSSTVFKRNKIRIVLEDY
jgi:hypothetical protein